MGLWSVHHTLSLLLLVPQREDSSHSSPAPVYRFLSRETVLHKLLQRESLPRAAALHELPQHGSPPTRCSPSGTGCSSMGTPRGHEPFQQTCSGMGSSLHRSAGPGRSLLQCGLPTVSQLPSGIHLLQCGVPSTGCRWISAPPWTFMNCRGTACLTMVCIMGCREISAPAPEAPPAPLSSLNMVSAELFLSHRLTPLSSLPFYQLIFLPLLKYIVTEVLSPSLIGSAL